MVEKKSSQKAKAKLFPVLLIAAIVIIILFVGGRSILSIYKNYNEGNIVVFKSEWPSDLPENIPPFTDGRLIGYGKNIGSNGYPYWLIHIDDVDKYQLAKYKTQLNASGWNTDSDATSPLMITRLSKGDYKIMIGYTPSPTEIDLVITVSRK